MPVRASGFHTVPCDLCENNHKSRLRESTTDLSVGKLIDVLLGQCHQSVTVESAVKCLPLHAPATQEIA